MDVLKEIMPSERDLIRVVVEIIVELRENDELEDVDNILGDVSVNGGLSTSGDLTTTHCSWTTKIQTSRPRLTLSVVRMDVR